MLVVAAALAGATALAAGCGGTAVDAPEGVAPETEGGGLQLDSLRTDDGFAVGVYARGLSQPRMMAWSPAGVLHVTQPVAGQVVALPDRDADGVADETIVLASGLDRVHGIAFHEGWLYVAESGRVLRYRHLDGEGVGGGRLGGDPEVIVSDLPPGGQHWSRTIAFGPDGSLYVSVGSSCNVCEEEDPRRAAVTRYSADGGSETLFATGLRNSVGLAFHPATGELWATDNGRDWLGDDLPPEEINVIEEGAFYGWPYAYGDRVPDPEYGALAPERVEETVPPVVSMQAHTAPLGLVFCCGDPVPRRRDPTATATTAGTAPSAPVDSGMGFGARPAAAATATGSGGRFPEELRGDLFVAQHGSWNRSRPVGYQVVRIELGDDGSTPGAVVPFVSGFLRADGAWGRPVDVSFGPDGALYVTDDANGVVYRVRFTATEERR